MLYHNVCVLFLLLLEREVVRAQVMIWAREGRCPFPMDWDWDMGCWVPHIEETVEKTIVGEWEDSDGAVSRFENGIQEADLASDLERVRRIADILNNSIRTYFGKDPEVDAWVKSLGGYRRTQERLVGLKLTKKSWYARTCARLKDELGAAVPAMGEPMPVFGMDSATNNSGYAVDVHRSLANQRRHGILYDPEDDQSEPDWRQIETERRDAPFWWSGISIGKFRKQRKVSKMEYRPEGGSGGVWRWMPDIRIADTIGGYPFTVVGQKWPWSVVQERPIIKDLLDRFYNRPRDLTWVKVGKTGKERWHFGMQMPDGKWLYAPVTGKSSQSIDWHKENEGKAYVPKGRRALFYHQWVITYRKIGEETLLVTIMKTNSQTGVWEIWKEKKLHYKEWWSMKKEALNKGAVDAYLGYPEKVNKG